MSQEHDLLREAIHREVSNLRRENEQLKDYLRAAILTRGRTIRRTIEVDSAGNTYEVDWLQSVKVWAKACGLDLEQHTVEYFD